MWNERQTLPPDGRQSETALMISRGVRRLLRARGFSSLTELPLTDGRRADIAAVNRDGEVLDDPGSFRSKEVSKSSALEYILQGQLYPDLYRDFYHKVRIEYYPPRGDQKEAWDNIDIFGWLGYPMQIKVNFLCRDSILAAPIALDLVLFLDLAKRTPALRSIGIQEWLSFYLKSPQTAEGLYPEHDLFIQSMKLKNTLRYIMGEDLITHLGLEYYD